MQVPRSWILCATLALFCACSGDSGPPLVASDVVIPESPPGRAMSAGYLTLSNHSNDVIRVSRITSPQFGTVEMHETLLEDGIARMHRVPELSIPAHSSVSLQPGSRHLMLMRPIGNVGNISLNFYDDETLLLNVQASITRREN